MSTQDSVILGSPPRAWGQLVHRKASRRRRRFTPTGVGTTSVPPLLSRFITGSPPRALGQRDGIERRAYCARFTPTGVGTTTLTATQEYLWEVHPHGRGDNDFSAGIFVLYLGSPPRAWGQRGRCR